MATTQKTIYLAAFSAAASLTAVTSKLELHSKRLEAFKASELDERDYEAFESHFDQCRNTLLSLERAPAPSVVADLQKAALEAEAKKATQTA